MNKDTSNLARKELIIFDQLMKATQFYKVGLISFFDSLWEQPFYSTCFPMAPKWPHLIIYNYANLRSKDMFSYKEE